MKRLFVTAALLLALLLASASTPAQPAKDTRPNAVEKLPDKPPAWLAGYRLRWPLCVVGDPAKQTATSVLASLPTGGWLKPDAADIAVQTASGQQVPVTVLSHDPAGETIIQFKRQGNDSWYWAYGLNPNAALAKAEPIKEGLTVEVRDWAGDTLDSWAAVREGLQKSDNVIGNALVPDLLQNCNPARPGEPRRFAASYRGCLDVKKAGTYRFLVNAEDAVFLFIDGFKVFERPGTNAKLTGPVPLQKVGKDVDLTAGIHPFEVHHVIGNNPNATGSCVLLWVTPEAKTWAFVPRENLVQGMYANVRGIEEAAKAPVATFHHGIDDSLSSAGVNLYLVRFEAQGPIQNETNLRWDFGDGTTATGRSVTHVYFKQGNYRVSLASAAGLAPFQRNVHVWAAPGTTSPLSLEQAVRSLETEDWTKADVLRINQMFEFLLVCEQPTRWALLDRVAAHLLEQKELDAKVRATLLSSRIEALAELGRAEEALRLAEKVIPEFARVPTLQVGVKLSAANVYHRFLKDTTETSKRYKAILEEHRRLEHPALRQTVIRWGDLFAEAGDLTRAAETYRLATTLGGEKFKNSPQSEAVTRGATLRIAEQRLRTGDVRQTRQLLEKIELESPEQKLEGLYRFLRAEADRNGGRYEEALRNYEILLKLTQWAGFHDRALFGIADSYYRLNNPERALKWLDSLKESFPRYYDKQMLADYRKMVAARLDWVNAHKNDLRKAESATVFTTGFEPEERETFGNPQNFVIVPGMGLQGPHVGLLDGYPAYKGYFTYTRPLTGLMGDATYWVEMWYRDTLALGAPSNNPHIHVWIVGEGQPYNGNAGMGTLYFERTLGRWRKLSFAIKGPSTPSGRLEMSIRHIHGVMEIDAIRVRPVTARQQDSLVNFLEGTEQP